MSETQQTGKVVRGVYYIGLYGGRCGLMAADTLRQAKSRAFREQGTSNVSEVRPATKRDVAHISGMGGYVPEVAR